MHVPAKVQAKVREIWPCVVRTCGADRGLSTATKSCDSWLRSAPLCSTPSALESTCLVLSRPQPLPLAFLLSLAKCDAVLPPFNTAKDGTSAASCRGGHGRPVLPVPGQVSSQYVRNQLQPGTCRNPGQSRHRPDADAIAEQDCRGRAVVRVPSNDTYGRRAWRNHAITGPTGFIMMYAVDRVVWSEVQHRYSSSSLLRMLSAGGRIGRVE